MSTDSDAQVAALRAELDGLLADAAESEAELQRFRAENARLRQGLADAVTERQRWMEDVDRLRAENARLRAAMEDICAEASFDIEGDALSCAEEMGRALDKIALLADAEGAR